MVKSLLTLLNSRQNNILTGASILMVAVFGSKFLGLIRDRLLVHNFDSSEAAIFFAAFKLPDLLFQLLIFGALSVAFIPVFTDYFQEKKESEAYEFASNILNLSLLTFTVVSVLAAIFISPINSLIVPGFSGEQKAMTDSMSRIILLSQILLIVGSFFVAISQSFQRFIIPALAPLFYNIGIIVGIMVFSPYMGISGTAWGAVLGALLHVLVQFPLVRSLGFRYRLSLNIFDNGVKQVFKLMSVRNIGLAAEQLNDAVGIALASLISYSSITLLTFAQHLQTVPIGLFGATIAQAALPVLSREQSQKDGASFKATLLTTMHQILFLTLPATAILIVLRIPVVRLVFGAAQFSWDDTVLTGRTVALMALGVAAQSVILLMVRGFYALKDTRTPVIVSIVSVLVNIILSFIFIRVLELNVWSLGLSYAIASNIALFLLIHFLSKKVGGFPSGMFAIPAMKMLLAAVVAAAALYIPMKALDQLVFDTTKTLNLIILTGIASFVGLSIYLLLVWFMKVEEVFTFGKLIKKFAGMQSELKTKEMNPENGPMV